MRYLEGFAAGFLSTLVFHQGLLTLLWAMGALSRVPYDMHATGPLAVPAVISLAFWGGVWGTVIGPALQGATGGRYWWRALWLGAVAPSAVALLIVLPLKGMPVAGGFDPRIIAGAFVLNGAWGLGVGLLMRLIDRVAANVAVAPA